MRTRALPILLAVTLLRCGGESADPTGASTPPSAGPQGTVITPVMNEGWLHVTEGSTLRYASNPPASGPHYPVWARYQEFATVLPRGYWVHNLEHGAIVFLYRPDAPASAIEALRDVYRGLSPDSSCGHSLSLMTADPELTKPVAAVAADWVLTADGVDAPTIQAFVAARRNRGPEKVCSHGTR